MISHRFRSRQSFGPFRFPPLSAAAAAGLLLAAVPSGALAHSPGHHECQQSPGHIWYESRSDNRVRVLDPTTGRLGSGVLLVCLHVGNPHRQADSGAADEIANYNNNGTVDLTISIDSDWGPNDYYSPVDGVRIQDGTRSATGETTGARRISGRN